jgi:hypothetical protein
MRENPDGFPASLVRLELLPFRYIDGLVLNAEALQRAETIRVSD